MKKNSNKNINRLVYFTPRVLSIIFILFLALMSLDALNNNYPFFETLLRLLIHNIPTIILLAVLIISWKYEIVGGIGFLLTGILYIIWVFAKSVKSGFEWYYLLWILQVSGTAFFIGIMFLVGWNKNKTHRKSL